MSYQQLRKDVFKANLAIKKSGLVLFTWGNVSVIDRSLNVVGIKPSGVPYDVMKEQDIVITDLEGNVIDGKLKPSVDLNTHLEIYNNFKDIKSVVHTHSTYATAWAQKARSIPLFGTTHADYFSEKIPCVRYLREEEMETYELSTGKAIVETFEKINYLHVPGCIVSGHGVFAWGNNSENAVYHATVLEEIAKIAYLTETLPGEKKLLPKHISNTHYQRKHGKNKTYGQ